MASFFNEFCELASLLESENYKIEKIFRQVKLRDNKITNIQMDLDSIAEISAHPNEFYLKKMELIKCCIDIVGHDKKDKKKPGSH